MRKLIPLILLIFTIRSVYSQQANRWYFEEEAGLNFNTNNAQPVRNSQTNQPSSNAVSGGISIPFGEFSETHFAGISFDYSWSKHRFGPLNKLPEKIIGFIANGGIDYYFGKKETVAGYDYKYGGYTYLHAFGGIIYNPIKKANINLTAGPTLGIYKGGSDIGFGISWHGSYYFTDRFAITPGIIYMKHKEANALWAALLQASYEF